MYIVVQCKLILTIPLASSAVTFKSHVVAYMYEICLLVFTFLLFLGEALELAYILLSGIPIYLTLSCIKIWIKKKKKKIKMLKYVCSL